MSLDTERKAPVGAEPRRRWPGRRIVLAALGPIFAVATFAYFLPQIADYRDVWGELKDLTWPAVLGLAAATILNLVTFAPPWQVVLPGLRFRDALALSQVSTALSIVVPGGAAAGIAGSYAVLRRWGFRPREIGRAVTLFSVSNQFANLSYPVIAVFLLTVFGGESGLLATAAFIGVAILGVAVRAAAPLPAKERHRRNTALRRTASTPAAPLRTLAARQLPFFRDLPQVNDARSKWTCLRLFRSIDTTTFASSRAAVRCPRARSAVSSAASRVRASRVIS